MTVSASTPRIRLTQAWYVLVLLLVAVSSRDTFGEFGGTIVNLTGLVLMIVAALGRIWTSVHIAGYKDERLVTTGPYSLCRNPLYALSLLGGIGVGLATRSLPITIATLVLLGVLYFGAIRAEERVLRAGHGRTFEEYCARVPRFLPRFATEPAPARIEVAPGVLWKAFLDAGAFLALYVAIGLLDALHATGALPAWLNL